MGQDKNKRIRDTRTRRTGRDRRRNQVRRMRIILAAALVLAVAVIVTIAVHILGGSKSSGSLVRSNTGGGSTVFSRNEDGTVPQIPQPELDVQLLTVNPYSRPGTATETITGVVVHYTANPGSTAQNNRDYFEGLKDSGATSVSSNFVIGLEGEVIQCVPTAEVAYASNSRNSDTVSIECCHPDETGVFNQATYDSLVELVAFLCGKFNLDADQVIRHYDVTGKECPLYYVEHEDEWARFKEDVSNYISEYGE